MITIRSMSQADVPLGMRLKEQAHWNQVEADWRRFLALEPEGCFVAESDGVPVGTTTTCIFGPVAWVAAVLVDTNYRGKGIGRALMEHALAFLDRKGMATIRLDATPLGRPLYEKLGFELEYDLARFDGTLPTSAGAQPSSIRPWSPDHFESVIQLDRGITCTNRGKLLQQLIMEQSEDSRVVLDAGAITGYLTARPGSNAWFIGPCLGNREGGTALLADAFQRYAGKRVYVDIPLGNMEAVQLAKEQGLSGERPLFRMSRGIRVNEDYTRIWAGSGPEKG